MKVYVVSNGEIQTGQFRSMKGDTVMYTSGGELRSENIRNVFFRKRHARYFNLQQHGVYRPVLNGTSQKET